MCDVVSISDAKKDYKILAVEKIDKELKEFSGDKYGNAVHTYVANALHEFCSVSDRFAEVVYKTKRSLSDCISEIMKGCGAHISDIEVYRRAARFYFPNSEVEFVMKITITGEVPDESYLSKEAPKSKVENKETSKPKKKEPVKSVPKKVEKPKKKEPEVIQLSLF